MLRFLWRYRVLIAGTFAIGLALAGEAVLRSVPAPVPGQNPPTLSTPTLAWLGNLLLGLAALLVGLVAWVNDGIRVGRGRVEVVADPAQPAAPLGGRAVRSRAAEPQAQAANTSAARRSAASTFQEWALRYSTWRTRVGWYGTGAGLAVAGALAVWLALMLAGNWQEERAGWVWLAIMAVLALTFAGVRPWPRGASLITHDPAEPAYEPPISRNEWIALGVIMLAAVVLRLWNLASIPAGPYIDEAGRAISARNINYGLPVNREQFVFFGTGWWGVPSFYFWLVAQSMKVFGDKLAGCA